MPFILGRIAIRTGVALWRHRLALIGATLLVVASGAYQLTLARPSIANGDCADTAMAALTHVTDAGARAAYACLGPAMRTTSEDQFVTTLQQRAGQNGKADRVADQRPADGGKIVFFTVSATGMAPVGYIIYLDPQGKVVKVE